MFTEGNTPKFQRQTFTTLLKTISYLELPGSWMAQDHLESGLGYQFLTSNMLIDSLQRASLKPISEIHHDD